uniref:BRCT domain-containing protein n=1 Tax=Aplanochytrium stocchinoi TaxID=215587 RepID=A0A7S3LM16_9STRA
MELEKPTKAVEKGKLEPDQETKISKKTRQQIESEKRIKSLSKKLKSVSEEEPEEENGLEKKNLQPEEEEKKVFAGDEGQEAIQENQKKIEALTNLFGGMKFWLSREVPFEPLEFCITSFGGKVINGAGGFDARDESITHHVTDRDMIRDKIKSREYVQPQWVFDCINAKLVLPVSRYAPDAKDLPPHLSPFVDDVAEGYMPLYAEEINKLRSARATTSNVSGLKLLTKEESIRERKAIFETTTKMGEGDEGESSEEEDSQDEVEIKYNQELEAEKRGEKANEEEEEEEEEEDEEEQEEDEEHQREQQQQQQEEEEEKIEDEKVIVSKKKETKPEKSRFIGSRGYKSSKKGYVFRMGKQGLGYYLDVNANKAITFKPIGRRRSKRTQRIAQKKEEEEMRHMMMSKKAKRLYGRMQHGINKKNEKVQALKRKRDALSSENKKKRTR